MAGSEAQLFALFEALKVTVRTLEHPPVFTVAESEDIHRSLPGLHTKNLFLKDDGGRFWLVTAPAEAPVDLKALRFRIGSKRLSFGKAEALIELLGVEPGSVTPLAVINDSAGLVTLVLDASLTRDGPVNVHPLRNSATVGLPGTDLVRVLTQLAHPPIVVDLTAG